MSTLEARTLEVEDRTDRLELLFERFLAAAAHDRAEAARDREEAARDREEDRAEAARYRAEAARDRKEMNRRWGELANKMGTVVQDIVAPSLRRIARDELGCGDDGGGCDCDVRVVYYVLAMEQNDGTMPSRDRSREPVGSPHFDTRTDDAAPAVGRPKSYDPDWQERIERVRSAREDGRKARQGKPIVFSIDDPRPLT